MDKNVKLLDFTRLVMSILAIVFGILLIFVVGNYYNNLKDSSAVGTIFSFAMMPIIFVVMACIIINLIQGIWGIKKYLDNKNIPLEGRKIKKDNVLVKSIIAIVGLSLPMLIICFCDINEYNKHNGENE